MKILIVEDDELKASVLQEYFHSSIEGATSRVAASFRGGLDAALTEKHDLLVVDMSLPTFDVTADEGGGWPRAFGGEDLLRQLVLRGGAFRAVVVTQFDVFGEGANVRTLAELDAELRSFVGGCYIGSVFFDGESGSWRASLSTLLLENGISTLFFP